MHISWTEYTASMSGHAIKQETCQQCQAEYVYVIERSATGQATTVYGIDAEGTRNRSQTRAQEKLERYLADDFDIVPCPSCGTYQPQMVASLQRSHHIGMFLLGALLLLLAFIALVIAGVLMLMSNPPYGSGIWAVIGSAVVMVIVGVGLILTRNALAAKFDPNAGDPEERKTFAQSRAILKKDLPRR